jgi:hypothetical protein
MWRLPVYAITRAPCGIRSQTEPNSNWTGPFNLSLKKGRQVPHTPGFPVRFVGVGELHAAFARFGISPMLTVKCTG